MSPTAPQQQQWQHTALSLLNFVAFLSNFLVAFAPLPQAITVYKRNGTGSLRMSVYHLTCVNFLYATLYALEIKNTSIMISSLVNWCVTLAFTLQLVVYVDGSQRVRCCLLVLLCVAFPVASARACHRTAMDCTDVLGTLNNVFNVVSFGAPLIALQTVWRSSDASSMPLSVSLMNLVNSTSWWLFGRMLADPYISFSNGLGALLSALQVAVIVKVSRNPTAGAVPMREHSV